MFSVVPVCSWGGEIWPLTMTYWTSDLQTCSTWTSLYRDPPPFLLPSPSSSPRHVQTCSYACTVGKRVVGILLECFLVVPKIAKPKLRIPQMHKLLPKFVYFIKRFFHGTFYLIVKTVRLNDFFSSNPLFTKTSVCTSSSEWCQTQTRINTFISQTAFCKLHFFYKGVEPVIYDFHNFLFLYFRNRQSRTCTKGPFTLSITSLLQYCSD